MIAWILSIWANPLARKITIGVLVILALGYALRRYSNRIYDEGYKSGKVAATAEMLKAKQAEWKAKEAAIAADAANITTEKRAVEAAAGQLAQDRITINRSFKDALAVTAAQRNRDYESTFAVPDSQLWGVIRSVSGQLATRH